MSGVEYDIRVPVVQSVVTQVGASAVTVRAQSSAAMGEGSSVAGACGTAQRVAGAFTRLWASRSETGIKSGTYGQGCAAAVGLACQVVSEGDGQMAQRSSVAAGVAASAARFGARGV